MLEIPEKALREAFVNAIIHRDYFIQGAHINVEVFSDRVEISSPGTLPHGLDKMDFGKRSLLRNPILADMLSRTPYIEKLGTGIPHIKSELQKAGLDAAKFDFGGFVTVTVNRKL